MEISVFEIVASILLKLLKESSEYSDLNASLSALTAVLRIVADHPGHMLMPGVNRTTVVSRQANSSF